jgi:hypothetical protein
MSPNVVADSDYYKFATNHMEKIVGWDTQAMNLDKQRYMLSLLEIVTLSLISIQPAGTKPEDC